MTDAFFGIHWAHAHILYLTPLVLCVCGIAVWYLMRVRGLMRAWMGDGSRRPLLWYVKRNVFFVRMLCVVGAFLLLFVALLRPQWGNEETVVSGSGRAVLVALDVSRSMCAQDVKPSRIALAKKKIQKLLHLLKADRVGLLIFSGEALVLCPLTTDYEAFSMFLDNVAVEAVSSGTTSLGAALTAALTAFNNQERESTRLVVLFSDGEDFSGRVQEALDSVCASGVRLCMVGVGSSEGGPIPVYDRQGVQSGFLKDQDGHVVVSRPQMNIMKDLAEKTGGLFVSSLDDKDDDMARVNRWIDRFTRSAFGEHRTMRQREQFFWYTGAAFLLLLVGAVI